MALKLGELATVLSLDAGPLDTGLEKAKETIQQHGKTWKGITLAAGTAAGAAAGAAIAVGLAGAIEKGRADSLLATQLGATPEVAERIGELSGKVYSAGFGANIQDVNEAIKNAAQNGFVNLERMSADAAKKVTENLLTVSTVLQEDTGRVSAAVTQMIRTGMVKSSEEAMDLLIKATQGGLNKAGDLLDTLNEYPTVLKPIGIDGRTAMGLMSQGLQAGARDSDKVADALKELSVRAVDGSATTINAFKLLGVNARTMAADIAAGGPRAAGAVDMILDKLRAMPATAERAQIVQDLFGGPGEDLGAAIFALDVDKASQSMGDLAGTTDKAGKALGDSAGAKLDQFKRGVQQALIEKMAEALPAVQAVFGWLSENSGWVTPLAVGLGVLAGAIWLATAATAAWNAVLAVNPITWIVLAVVGLIAVIVLIATKTDWFQRLWGWAWGGIKSAASAVGSWFKDTLWGKWIKGAWDGIKSGGEKVLGWFKDLPGNLKKALLKVGDIISAPYKAAFNAIARFWNSTAGKLSFSVPEWVPKFGGRGFSMPKLPQLAVGGRILESGLAVVHRGEVVQPAKTAPLAGGGMATLRLIVQWPDGRTIKDELIDAASLRGQSVGRYLGVAGA